MPRTPPTLTIVAAARRAAFPQGTDNTPPEKVKGQPWMSVLKDVAQTATSVDTALEIIEVRLVSLSPLKGALLLMFLRVLGAAAFFCSRLASSFRTAGYVLH